MYSLTKSFILNSRAAIQQVVFSKRLLSLWWGYVGMLLVNLAAYPILTNLYSPHQFGEFAIYTNTVLFLAGFGALCFDKAIVLAKSRTRAVSLFHISLGLLSIVCLLGFILIVCFYDKLNSYFQFSEGLKLWWYLLPLLAFTSGAFYAGSGYLLRKKAFKELSKLRILLRATTIVVQLVLALLVGFEFGLIAGFGAGFLLIFIVLLIKSYDKIAQHRWSFSFARQSWFRFSDFPKFSFPQKLLNDFSARIPFLIIPFFFGMEEVGYFSVAYGLLNLPGSLVSSATGEAFFQRISVAPLQEVKKHLCQYWLVLFLLGLFPFGFLFACGEPFFTFILGSEWQMTGSMVSVMAPMFFLSFLRTPTSRAFMVMRKQKYSLYFGFSSLLFRPALFYVGYLTGSIYQALFFWVVFEVLQSVIFLKVIYSFANKYATELKEGLKAS